MQPNLLTSSAGVWLFRTKNIKRTSVVKRSDVSESSCLWVENELAAVKKIDFCYYTLIFHFLRAEKHYLWEYQNLFERKSTKSTEAQGGWHALVYCTPTLWFSKVSKVFTNAALNHMIVPVLWNKGWRKGFSRFSGECHLVDLRLWAPFVLIKNIFNALI